jgi:hypothetical protein
MPIVDKGGYQKPTDFESYGDYLDSVDFVHQGLKQYIPQMCESERRIGMSRGLEMIQDLLWELMVGPHHWVDASEFEECESSGWEEDCSCDACLEKRGW